MRRNPEANPVGLRPKATRIWSVRQRTIVLACMVGALVTAGCGSSGAKSAPRGSHTTRPATTIANSTTTIDQLAADKAEITAVFNGWVQLNNDLKQSSNDWQDPRLSNFLAGDALNWSKKVLKERHQKGETSRAAEPSKARAKVLSIRIMGGSADVSTCEVNDSVLIAKDGSILDDRVVTYFDMTSWRRIKGKWRMWSGLSERTVAGEQKCD